MIEIKNRKSKQKYIILFFLILIFSTTFFIMYRYHVEGEKNLPFNITKLVVVSSAKTEEIELKENTYEANVIQKNDIYIAIEKNQKFSKEESIKKITFNNFKIVENPKKGTVKFYRSSNIKNSFEYIQDYEIKERIEYIGARETNLNIPNMTIANQGGLIELSFIVNELGSIIYSENDNIVTDGTLLNRLQLTTEEVKHKVSFDMIMEMAGGNTFKTTILLELPKKDVVAEGVTTEEKTDFSKLVFKRI